EDGLVGQGKLRRQGEQLRGYRGVLAVDSLYLLEDVNGIAGPAGPLAKEPPCHAKADGAAGDVEAVAGEEVSDDIVVISGIEGDFVGPAGCSDGLKDVQRLVAIEGGDLYGMDVGDFDETAPEGLGQRHAADVLLQIEAYEGDDLGD